MTSNKETALRALKEARALLGEGGHRWTRGTYARNAEGEEVVFDSPNATCWCALGALLHVAPAVSPSSQWLGYWGARDVLDEECVVSTPYPSVPSLNDKQGYKAVLELYDRAIARAEQQRQQGTQS